MHPAQPHNTHTRHIHDSFSSSTLLIYLFPRPAVAQRAVAYARPLSRDHRVIFIICYLLRARSLAPAAEKPENRGKQKRSLGRSAAGSPLGRKNERQKATSGQSAFIRSLTLFYPPSTHSLVFPAATAGTCLRAFVRFFFHALA